VSETLQDRLDSVKRRIAAAASAAHRDPSTVTLISVSKTHPPGEVDEAVAAGALDLGENRVQEARAKKPDVRPARWHLIGPLQRNKAKAALEVFDVVHTVDRVEIAERLQFLLAEHWRDRVLDVLIEVNVGGEAQKAGVAVDGARDLLDVALSLDRLAVRGVMAIPPYDPVAENSRPHFRALRQIRDRLQDETGRALPELSMGMSHDFEIAVAEGATMVRIGTAIFGPRKPRG
jgi:pyridoxal phosphate enzyme (YggS family)